MYEYEFKLRGKIDNIKDQVILTTDKGERVLLNDYLINPFLNLNNKEFKIKIIIDIEEL